MLMLKAIKMVNKIPSSICGSLFGNNLMVNMRIEATIDGTPAAKKAGK